MDGSDGSLWENARRADVGPLGVGVKPHNTPTIRLRSCAAEPPELSVNTANVTRTSTANGRLWGTRAMDWAHIQEGQCRTAYEAVFDTLALRPHAKYCDVGCGAGLAALLASQRGVEVCGIDAAESLLEIARERVAVADFRLADLEELPFPDGTFALSDEIALRALAESAGLTALEVSEVACRWQYHDLDTALRGLGSSGVAAKAAEHTSVDSVNRSHAAALAPFRQNDGSYRLEASFRWLLAAP